MWKAIVSSLAARLQGGERGVPQWVLDGRSDSGTGIFTWNNFGSAWSPEEPLRSAGLIGPVVLKTAMDSNAVTKK